MDLEFYRNFIAMMETKNLTATSELVHIAQPALSKQLRILENYYGTKLLITNRGSRQLVPTDAGIILYNKAKAFCQLEEESKNEIGGLEKGFSGTLRFGVSNARCGQFIRNCLSGFHALYPQINFELHEATISILTKQLLNGITEIGIFSVPFLHQDDFDVLFRREEYLGAVFSKDNLWGLNPNHRLVCEDLRNVPISISNGCLKLFQQECMKHNFQPDILCNCTSRHSALHWAYADLAVAVVATEPGENLLKDNIVVRPLTNISTGLFKTIVTVRDRSLSPSAKLFIEYYAKNNPQQVFDDFKHVIKPS